MPEPQGDGFPDPQRALDREDAVLRLARVRACRLACDALDEQIRDTQSRLRNLKRQRKEAGWNLAAAERVER